MKYFLSLLSFFALTTGFAQELTVVGKTYNVSDNINDGAIELEVDGGVEPYTYKWSDQETPLTSKSAQGLVEGIAYTVVVTDAAGNSVTKEFTVETQSITEVFNGTMTPAVGGLGSVLFWDPFAAIGIYDPVAYADVKLIGIPDWSNETQDKFILKEWLKENRASVVEGEDVAIITSDKRGDITIQANAKGKLVQKVKQGNVIYNSENQEHVIEQGAHYFAEIEYDEPVAMLHPNGDPIIKGIPFIVIWLVFGALFFTLRMGFINIRGFKHSIDLAKGKYDDPSKIQ